LPNNKEAFLFELFPSTKQFFLDWIYDSMADLTCNNIRQYLIDTVLPDLDATKDSLTEDQQYRLLRLIDRPPSETTIWRWLKVLGFVYDVRKKTFYVDGHEKAEQRFNRLLFSQKYLTELEPHMNRWIRLSKEEFQLIVNAGTKAEPTMDEKWLLAGYEHQDDTLSSMMTPISFYMSLLQIVVMEERRLCGERERYKTEATGNSWSR
jgi:hypothetical protein